MACLRLRIGHQTDPQVAGTNLHYIIRPDLSGPFVVSAQFLFVQDQLIRVKRFTLFNAGGPVEDLVLIIVAREKSEPLQEVVITFPNY